ncbi:MAG: N-acetyltransferase [Alphaproteobacteria bacterium]|jgi:putative acetyltransferase|nr:N-acetyltransferase [Alphaproteobacteria bacterium]MBT4082514.1 N-acetyltransferase [Alphaproteobacteria bacterium]MBT4543496.1 N-acetyltransferase [Alphaproteobacteria bacterium]MBT6387874.1 N-acetyltransferase [Alphaproteobacteria bacterium]MBT7745610.1 N-acetyltransferase [Alphaproteobacteria bacterium]
MINFRLEGANESDLIHDLVHKSFGQEAEAVLVKNLCADGDALISLVAVDDEDNSIVGHILFSDTPVGTTKNLLRGAAMAPLSVSETHQGQGIGGGLVIQGLRECRDSGIQVVLVLGDPNYYGRFGFSADIAKDLDTPYKGEFFQALEIEPGILNGVSGKVLYPNAFSKLA